MRKMPREILKDAGFGDEFVTVGQWKAIYLGLQDPQHKDVHVLALADHLPYRFVKKYNVHGRCLDAMRGEGCPYDIDTKWSDYERRFFGC